MCRYVKTVRKIMTNRVYALQCECCLMRLSAKRVKLKNRSSTLYSLVTSVVATNNQLNSIEKLLRLG